MNFWTGVVFVLVIAVFWSAIVLTLLQVRITTPFPRAPRWVSRLVQFFADATPACPRCGRPAVALGRRQGALWFGCATCDPVVTWTQPATTTGTTQPDALTKRTA